MRTAGSLSSPAGAGGNRSASGIGQGPHERVTPDTLNVSCSAFLPRC